ncbi:MAG: winged helix DNA-binding protein [Halobacteriota archaeon]|nr:winged helix DNA-binding protein [Halobacteriota archaeon]
MPNEIENLLLQKKPVQILLTIDEIEKPYTSTIIKEVDTTFAHATNLLSEMERLDLVNSTKEGRVKYIELTEYGKMVVTILKRLVSVLQKYEIFDKISHISSKIERIFEEEIKDKDTLDKSEFIRISKRLGPYQREIGKLTMSSEEYDDEIQEKVSEIKDRIDELVEIKGILARSKDS